MATSRPDGPVQGLRVHLRNFFEKGMGGLLLNRDLISE